LGGGKRRKGSQKRIMHSAIMSPERNHGGGKGKVKPIGEKAEKKDPPVKRRGDAETKTKFLKLERRRENSETLGGGNFVDCFRGDS